MRDPYLNSFFAQVVGVILGITLIIPPLIRLGEGRWTGFDWIMVIGGVVIASTWLVLMIMGTLRRKRNEAR